MTNREYLESLDDKTFAQRISTCECCIYDGSSIEKCAKSSCLEGMVTWLGRKHEGKGTGA